MNETELKKAVRAAMNYPGAPGRTAKDVDLFFGALIAVVGNHLDAANGDADVDAEVHLPGLGALRAKTRAARQGRNPRTGEKIEIAEKRVVEFHPKKALRMAVAGETELVKFKPMKAED